MNLNPSDDHIMSYVTGWDDNHDIGNNNSALLQDYLSQKVWNMPINNIAIVRHQKVGKVNLNVFHIIFILNILRNTLFHLFDRILKCLSIASINDIVVSIRDNYLNNIFSDELE